uniref:Uncharacterized protein n=1 Tax=Rhodnius prolixus TaxID=13249 RepID=T1HUE1_RHOPR
MSSEGSTEPLQAPLLASCCLVPGLNIVACSLKELPLHCPSCATDTAVPNGVPPSSSRRRKTSKPSGLPPADVFAQLTVEQIVMSRKPTLIDRLISQNKSALIMESRAKKRVGRPAKEVTQVNGKRKSNSNEEHVPGKKLRSSKNDGKKGINCRQKAVHQQPPSKRKKFDSDPTPSTNRYATRISMNKVRIPFSLRSGRKMADILKSKRKRVLTHQYLEQNDSQKKVKQLDTNSNTFNALDQREEKVKVEEIKPKRKKRKRCSMWVKKVKKPSRKVEDLPVLNKVESEEDEQETELEEEMELLMPTLEKQVDSSRELKLKNEETENESSLDMSVQDKRKLLEELEEVKSFELTAKVPINLENEQHSCEINLEVKTDSLKALPDTQPAVSIQEQIVNSGYDRTVGSYDKLTTHTQEIFGTNENRNNLHSMQGESIKMGNFRTSTREIVESEITARYCHMKEDFKKDLEPLKIKEFSKSEKEIIETEIKASNGGEAEISDIVGAIKIENQLDTKAAIINKVTADINETELMGSDEIDSEKIVEQDYLCYSSNLEGKEIILKNAASCKENTEIGMSLKHKSGDFEVQNSEQVKRIYDNVKEEVQSNTVHKDKNEELRPSEADSTSDVAFHVNKSISDQNFVCEEELKSTSASDVSVLPDSTKEVKCISPDIKIESDELTNQTPIILQKSGDDTVMISSNNHEHESNKMRTQSTPDKNCSVSEPVKKEGKLSVEQKQMKESVLQALGLKSLTAASEFKQQCEEDKQKCVQQQQLQQQQQQQQRNNSGYTGTLKAVIKLNRTGDKKRTMVYQRNEDALSSSDKLEYRICSDFPSTEGVPITHLADIGYNRKGLHQKYTDSVTNSVYVNPNNGTSHTEESEVNGDESKGNKESNLIIPEKSSSFSIHPGRLCSDVCSYCFGKFGSLDTPCHVAQIKGEERQKKILQNEPHLTPESCLCDACYRYVDRKVNYHPKSGNQQSTNSTTGHKTHQPQPQATCCVVNCVQQATHTIKRKWILKLKKNLTNKVEYLTVCGICRKRLNRNNLFSLGREADRLNLMLAEDGIPARLSDNLFLCKLCRYYSNLRLKYSDTSAIPPQNKAFYKNYRRKILMSLDIAVSNSDDDCEHSEDAATPEKKRTPSTTTGTSTTVLPRKASQGNTGGSNNSTAENVAGGSSSNNDSASEDTVSLSKLASLFGEQPEQQQTRMFGEQSEQQQTRIQVKFGNVNIHTLSNLNIGQQGGASTPVTGSNDKEGPEGVLSCHLDFKGTTTPDGALERCVCTIQFDKKAKQLWTDLQKPHGSQSLFLRHLIMMEKIWRAGYLVLSSNADEKAVKYVLNSKNKVRSFENSQSGTTGNSSNSSSTSPNNSVQTKPTKPKEVSQPSSQPLQPIRVRQQFQQHPQQPQPQPPQPQQQPQQPQLAAQSKQFLQPVHRPQQQQSQHPQLQHSLQQQIPKQQLNQQQKERFPLLPNTGEIEVTPIRTTAQPQVTIHPASAITVTASLQPQQHVRPVNQQLTITRPSHIQQTTSTSNNQHTVLQQQLMSKKLTPLDRAKSLVRMALPQHRPPPPRYYVPAQSSVAGVPHQYYSAGGSGTSRAPPPPLMKLQSYYQHQQQINQQSAAQQLPYQLHHLQQQQQHQQQPRTILPKLPKSLTVVSRMNSKPTAITLSHSGITIEKQSSVPPLRSSHPLPIEKPIISVFREPAVSSQQH